MPRTRYVTPQDGEVRFEPQVTIDLLNDFFKKNNLENMVVVKKEKETVVEVNSTEPLVVPDHVWVWVKQP